MKEDLKFLLRRQQEEKKKINIHPPVFNSGRDLRRQRRAGEAGGYIERTRTRGALMQMIS